MVPSMPIPFTRSAPIQADGVVDLIRAERFRSALYKGRFAALKGGTYGALAG